MGKKQKKIKGLVLLALMMFTALSIMTTGCGGDDGGDGSSDGIAISQQTLVSTWDITGSHPNGFTYIGTISLSADEALTYNLMQINNNPPPGQRPIISIGTGTWGLNGSLLTLTLDSGLMSGIVYQGTTQGSSTTFSMVCSNGWTLDFSRG